LNLAQAAIYLAQAPKSKASANAIWAARDDVRKGGNLRPPAMLRDAHYAGAKKLGHGVGYVDPHTDERAAELEYLPEELAGRQYYRPSGNGEEER
jgi:putative ATPase